MHSMDGSFHISHAQFSTVSWSLSLSSHLYDPLHCFSPWITNADQEITLFSLWKVLSVLRSDSLILILESPKKLQYFRCKGFWLVRCECCFFFCFLPLKMWSALNTYIQVCVIQSEHIYLGIYTYIHLTQQQQQQQQKLNKK